MTSTTATAVKPAAGVTATTNGATPTAFHKAIAQITAEIQKAKTGITADEARKIAADVAGPIAERVARETATAATARSGNSTGSSGTAGGSGGIDVDNLIKDIVKQASEYAQGCADGVYKGLSDRLNQHCEYDQARHRELDADTRKVAQSLETSQQAVVNLARLVKKLEAEVAEARALAEAGGGGELVVKTAEGLELGKVEGHTRREFASVAKTVAAGIPAMLVGPSGSGKTHLARQIAESLGLRFGFIALTAGVSESRLYGRFVPTGESGSFQYVEAEFVRFYRDGGLFLLDEVDAADPNVLLALNAAIANGHMETPNPDAPVVKMHQDFRIVIAANTYGHGADRTYCGRNQLDGATLDRFCCGKFHVDYDEAFERKAGDVKLVAWVHDLRKQINDRGLRRTASTRLVLDGTRALKAGFTLDDVKERYFLDWPQHERDLVERD